MNTGGGGDSRKGRFNEKFKGKGVDLAKASKTRTRIIEKGWVRFKRGVVSYAGSRGSSRQQAAGSQLGNSPFFQKILIPIYEVVTFVN